MLALRSVARRVLQLQAEERNLGRQIEALLPEHAAGGPDGIERVGLAARAILSPAELRIGVVTAFLGARFFPVVLRTSRTVGM